jgi:hypothetical protein
MVLFRAPKHPPLLWQWIYSIFTSNAFTVPLAQKGNWIRDVDEMEFDITQFTRVMRLSPCTEFSRLLLGHVRSNKDHSYDGKIGSTRSHNGDTSRFVSTAVAASEDNCHT